MKRLTTFRKTLRIIPRWIAADHLTIEHDLLQKGMTIDISLVVELCPDARSKVRFCPTGAPRPRR